MELSIKDRLYIPAILPKEGNFKDFNTKKEVPAQDRDHRRRA